MTTLAPHTPGVDFGSSPGERPARPSWLNGDVVVEVAVPVVSSYAFVALVFLLAHLWAWVGFGVSWLVAFAVSYGVLVWRRHGVLVAKDRLATIYVWSGAVAALTPLIAILWYVIVHGLPVVWAHFPHFLFADMSKHGPTDPVTKAGVGAAILGTVEQVGLTTVVTVPIAIMTATYLNEGKGLFARVVRLVVDSMTGTPSIIAGLFVYYLWVVPRHTNGKVGIAASLALAVLMLPFVTRTAEEVIRVVPGSLREAAIALGSPQWRMILRVVLPTARTGLVTAVILGVARAVGETAPLLLATNYSTHYNLNVFHGAQSDLPLFVYQYITTNQDRVAWGGAVVLVGVVLTLFVLARILGSGSGARRVVAWRRARQETAS